MPTRVKLPDGSTVVVQTDDTAQAAKAAQRYWATKAKAKPAAKPAPKALPKAPPKAKAAPKQEERGFWGTARDFVDNVTDNVLPNWGDEVAGFGGGVGTLILGQGYDKGYQASSQDYLKRQQDYKKKHPVLHGASAVGGTVLGAAVPVGRAAEGANLTRQAAQASGTGLAYGLVSGAGQGDTLEERGKNALSEGAMGAVFGAGTPYAVRGAQGAGRWARQTLPGVDTAYRAATALPSRAYRAAMGQPARAAGTEMADRLIGERMGRGNIQDGFGQPGVPSSPRAIANEVAQRRSQGVPAMVGDVTEDMRGLTEYAGRGAGPGQSLVRRALERRKATEGTRVRQHVQDTLPTTNDPIRYLEEAGQQARTDAAPLYEQAYAQPVFRNEAIQGIEQTPAFRSALGQAYKNIRNQIDPATGRPKDPTSMGFREMLDVDPNGLPPNGPYFQTPEGTFISYENGLSAEGYDQVIRAMRDDARNAGNINPITGRVTDNSSSVHIGARARDLRSELASQNAPYAEATQRYGDEMALNQAFEQGGQFGNATGHEVNAQLRAMPDAAQGAFTRGAGTSMADAASQYSAKFPTGNTANRVRQMMGDDVKQQALSTAEGNTGAVQDLSQRLEYEMQGNDVYNRVNGNSATAQRQQLDADLDTGAGIPTSGAGLVSTIVQALAQRATPQLQQQIKERIAQVVTASDAQSVQEVMAAIATQAERDASFRRLLQQASVGAAAVYGSQQAE